MDSLTQIVLGAAVGEAVLGKKLGNRAVFWGAVAGTIPDLDVLVNFFVEDKLTTTLMHRAFTHSFLFCFLISPILAFLFSKIFKSSNANFKDWTLLFFFGFLTHILLDVQTTYGTQLLWPIHNRLATSNIFVVDPLYTLPFMLFLIIAMFYKRTNSKRRKYNNLGLYISSSYLLLTFLFKGIAHYHFTKNLAEQNIEYSRIETGPTPLNSVLWYANIETDGAYFIGNYSLFDTRNVIPFKRIDKNKETRNELKNYTNFNRLNHFSKDWYVVSKNENGSYLYHNLRFGMSSFDDKDKEFVFGYELTPKNNSLIVKQKMNRPIDSKDKKPFFKVLGEIVSKIYQRAKGI